MKKKLMILPIMCLILPLVLLGACGTQSTDESTSEESTTDDSVITIQMSDEAKECEKKIRESGEKKYLEEEYFDKTMEIISDREIKQSLPECEVENELDCKEYDGCNVYSLEKEGYENIVLYTHGGGWMFEISTEHIDFCDKLVNELNAKVYMPLYALAPQGDSEECMALLQKVYEDIQEEGKNVYIMGDSAGGQITLELMYNIKEKDLEKPDKMVLLAPCSDMSISNEEIAEIEKTDPELASYGARKGAEMWVGKDNVKNPEHSALYADVTDYPDTMIIAGTNDILTPDNLLLFQNLKDSGVNATLVKGEGLWHVFSVSPIPEMDESLAIIKDFCAE